jgi:RNA polymerase sigma-70 factor (ECF subfamily)
MVNRAGKDLSDAEDLRLLDRVCERDSAAHRELFDRYYPRLYAFVLRRLGDRPLTEETVADVFFEVWRSAETFRGGSRVSSWIFGIAHFKSLRVDRDRRRAKRQSVIPTSVEYLHAVPDESDLEREVDARAELRRVEALLARLPADLAEVIRLAFVEGLEYAEIASRMGVSEGTIKSRVSRARRQLRGGMQRAPEARR